MNRNFETVHSADATSLGGLAWTGKKMLFSAIEASTIWAFDPLARQTSIWRKYTNRTSGIAFGPDSALFACQEGGRRVVRLLPDGSAVLTATSLEGHLHNHPRWIAVDAAGSAWFSDCHHSVPASGPQIFPALKHQSVLRLSLHGDQQWKLDRMTFDMQAPRGLALSPDGLCLYVVETGAEGAAASSQLRSYPIRQSGLLGENTVLCEIPGLVDGICVDSASRIFACVGAHGELDKGAVCVYAKDGHLLETYPVASGRPVHCAFGDADLRSLYVTTAQGQLLRIRTPYTGCRTHGLSLGN